MGQGGRQGRQSNSSPRASKIRAYDPWGVPSPLSSLTPHRGPTPSLAPAPEGTLLLLGIIHADFKDGGPLAAQKGHGGGRTACAPF